MPNIKLRDGSGVEQTYTGVDTITVPLADGTGTWTYGLTDEELTFSDCGYLITNSSYNALKKYINRINIIPYEYNDNKYIMLVHFSSNANVEDLSSIIIDCNGVESVIASYAFDNCFKLKKLPQLINNENCYISGNILYNSNDSITEDEILSFLNGFTKYTNKTDKLGTASNCAYVPYNGSLDNCLDLTEVHKKWHSIINNNNSYHNFNSTPNADISPGRYVKSIRNIPIQYIDTNARTSSIRFTGYSAIPFTDSFAFATNNGTPYTMNWKSQTIDLSNVSYTFGYSKDSYSTNYSSYAQGYWKVENNIFTSNSMTVEQATARYDGLKTTDNWYSCCNNSVRYDGKSLSLSLLFSRYNHDSAVETINSLPDTSAYLATAGGTNTIKFRNYSGACTDGGGTNDLTPEEIAVATAKGWTVTLV